MKKVLVVCLILMPAVALAVNKTLTPAVPWWCDDPSPRSAPIPRQAAYSADYKIVQIDTMTAATRFVYEHKQAILCEEGGDPWFVFAHNDNASHVRTIVFRESQLDDAASWFVADIYEWTGDGTLRYVTPTAFNDGSVWYPEVTFNTHAPSSDWHMVDEGGIGVGLWSPPIDILGPVYDYYLPLTEAGPDNVIYLDAQARDVASDSHVFKSFSGWDGTLVDPPGEVLLFPDDVFFGTNYENSQLLYRDGKIVVCGGFFRTSAVTDPTNPLLCVYTESTDEGNTWSDPVWLDQAAVPDMPGMIPGMSYHFSNVLQFDGVIDMEGDIHFIMAVVDSGCDGNSGYIHGLYDVHQDGGAWTASLISDGTYYVNADSTWDPRGQWLDGDSWVFSPTIGGTENGDLVAAWNDLGYVDPADSTGYVDIWYSWSTDGNTWHNPVNITDNMAVDDFFPRVLYPVMGDYTYIIYMVPWWTDGPIWMIQVPWNVTGAGDPSVRPAVNSLSAAPNPFTGEVAVSLTLATPGAAEAGVYNARGELVESLVHATLTAGAHTLVWNAGNAPAGIYVCRATVAGQNLSARLVLVR
jgi:hypothetical protein